MENSSRTWEMEDIGNRHGFPVKACGRKPALPQIRPRFHGRGFDLWMRDRGGGGVGHGARIFNAINAPYPRLAFRGGQCRTRIMHALFGVSQTRQGGNQAGTPPSSFLASKSPATISHDGSTTWTGDISTYL